MRDLAQEGWRLAPPNDFMEYIGPIWRREEGDVVAFALQTDERHRNIHGIVHGGVVMSLLDYALGSTASHFSDGKSSVTIQMDTKFMQAGEVGQMLFARAQPERVGASVIFMRGALEDETGKHIASASGVWKVIRPRQG